ncbi:lipase superfamily protein [Moumouvirus goulette]|uniref:Lipase superfamily protein n=1 Tax=Moumouvirus goulette TaxID=1247379 RepID=M1NLW8_9VIRU|nr:lipase superfamily protein [Moumouvirus goulette]AGF84995.1 lipase superfamily protein [Moumouvirus goulette]
MEYITPNNNQVRDTNTSLLSYYGLNESSDKSLQDAKSLWSLIMKNKYRCVYSEYGVTFQIDLSSRYYVVHLPYEYFNSNKKYSVILFLHGLTSWSWDCALRRTNLLKLSSRKNVIIIFGQGQGELLDEPIRGKEGGIYFGDTYWDMYNPQTDANYFDEIIKLNGRHSINLSNTIYLDNIGKEMLSKNIIPDINSLRKRINQKKIYLWGYSNGAMFASLMALIYGNIKYAGVCSMMGGWPGLAGYDRTKLVNISKLEINPTPIIIITGTEDTYLKSSKHMYCLTILLGFPNNKLIVLPSKKHNYPQDQENIVWKWFCRKS